MIPSAHPRGSHHHNGSDEVLAQRMAAHDRLAHQSQVVLRLGQMLLSFGASAYRVKKSMADVARAVGISEHRAQVTYTEIITTAYANGTFRTELAEQRLMGVNADKIDRINNYIASINGKSVRVEDVSDELDKIAKVPGLYDWFSNALASGLACAAFAFLNGGGWVECSAVAVAIVLRAGVTSTDAGPPHEPLRCLDGLRRSRRNDLHSSRCTGAAVFGYRVDAPGWLHFGVAVPCPWLPSGDGTYRLGEARLPGRPRAPRLRRDARCVGRRCGMGHLCDFWLVCNPRVWRCSCPVAALPAPLPDEFRRRVCFAMLFNSPQRVCAAAALIGAVINTARIALNLELKVPAPAAVGLAALAAGLLAVFVARRTRFSRVTLSVPAVVIMIPGVPLYRSLTYLNNQQIDDALGALFTVMFTIVAIGMGLALSRMLTDKNWLVEKQERVPNLWEYEEENA